MRNLLIIFIISFSINTFGQKSITFEVEELSKPEKLLYLQSYDDIYKNLILSDASLSKWEIESDNIDFKYDIIAKSHAPDSLVNFSYNSFFNGMYYAYSDHRPFVLSPDMIWLLISQGFARHVNANSEELRDYFVSHSGQLSLIVKSEVSLLYGQPNWEELFPQFTSQIAKHTGKELIETLTSNFSTTSSIEKVVSEITIMEAMKSYFEFQVYYSSCGIPEITLKGNSEDWQKVYNKTKKLSKYDLKWWTSELEPILEEFVNASNGNINTTFWKTMFKYHSQEKYGAPNIIDGWIVKFFPYDKDGNRNNLKELKGDKNLPEEIVKVDLKYVELDGINTKEYMLELWGGFIGLEQDPKTFALTPQISWMVKKKDLNNTGLKQKLDSDNSFVGAGRGINLKIIEVPEVLKSLKEIYRLGLNFEENVLIPEWLKEIRIGELTINGKISSKEKKKIISWFPKTEVIINEEKYNEGKNGWYKIDGDVFPEEISNLDEIWVLQIWELNPKDNIILEKLKKINIEHLVLSFPTSENNIKKIKKLFPNAKVYNGNKRVQ